MNSATISILLVTLLCHTVAVIGQRSNIWQIISTDSRLTILATALQAAGLGEAGQEDGSFTVFAPTDAAFSKVPPEIVQRLSDPQNINELVEVLAYHAIADKALTSTQLAAMNLPARLQTTTGGFITVTRQGNQIKINDATVVAADIMASNGVVHIIDTVLLPTSLSK